MTFNVKVNCLFFWKLYKKKLNEKKEVRTINKKIILLGLIISSIAVNAATYKTVREAVKANTPAKSSNTQNTKTGTVNEIIIPKGLKPGDTIGLIAPANYTNENSNAEIEYLTSRGYNVVYGQSFYSRWYGFGGTDSVRAKDINDMFANPKINAIFAVRGGYGGIRIVDKLNYDVIKKNPKIISGFSDNTTLLLAINEKTGLVTFHGPMADNLKDIPLVTENAFNKAFTSNESYNLLGFDDTYTIMKSGRGSGKITGGNLSLVVATLGTDHEINTDGKILFLEETNEASYRVDRMLKQLKLAGKFDKLQGIILGDFKNPKQSDPTDMTIDEVFYDNFGKLNVPIVKNFKSGHVRPFITVPIGAKAVMDTYKREIMIEKATK
nr:LD-carboxypeptidase [Leptotrichia sp. oral taxon 223]